MRIAAMIQAHHRPDLLRRLLRRLDTPLWSPVVHVDAKSDMAPFAFLRDAAAGGTVRVLDGRRAVYWAGFSQVAATLALLRAAFADEGTTHFCLMSGQCFPLHPDGAIAARVAGSGRGDLMDVDAMPSPTKSLDRLTQWHALERMRYGRARRALQRGVALLPARNLDRLLHGMRPHAGWSWFLLSRDTVGRMLEFLRREPWFEAAFRHSLCADEMFFQTLLAGLGLRPDGPCPTAARWVGDAAHPEPLDPAGIRALRAEGRWLLARKVVDAHPEDVE